MSRSIGKVTHALDRQPPISRHDLPSFLCPTIPHHDRFRMQRYRRANVPRHAIKTRAQFDFCGSSGFDYEMFFAVGNRLRIRQI